MTRVRISATQGELAEFLTEIEFLSGASRKLCERLVRELEVVVFNAGDQVFADEAPGDAAYFIFEGSIRIEKRGRVLFTRHRGECVGEMALINDSPRSAGAVAATEAVLLRWSKQRFLATLASNGEFAYRMCRTLSDRLREDIVSVALIQEERHRAAQLQAAMLPSLRLSNGVVDLAAYCLQADDVGGDYYDYLSTNGGSLGLIVADAQGHGFSAALLVAVLKTCLHGIREREPEAVLAAMNRAILDNLNEVVMATCFYVLLDPARREMRFASAGHIPQYHLRKTDGEIDELRSQSLLLGFPGPEEYIPTSEKRRWAPGDLLVLATDGVTEATNADDEEFGPERLQRAIFSYRDLEPEEIQKAVRAELRDFVGVRQLQDDVTFVVARLH